MISKHISRVCNLGPVASTWSCRILRKLIGLEGKYLYSHQFYYRIYSTDCHRGNRRGGYVEEADLLRMHDKSGKEIFCYQCGLSALGGKRIVNCDFCALYWHLDCLSPPMANPPLATRKWMCPAHAEQGLVRYFPSHASFSSNQSSHHLRYFVVSLASAGGLTHFIREP